MKTPMQRGLRFAAMILGAAILGAAACLAIVPARADDAPKPGAPNDFLF